MLTATLGRGRAATGLGGDPMRRGPITTPPAASPSTTRAMAKAFVLVLFVSKPASFLESGPTGVPVCRVLGVSTLGSKSVASMAALARSAFQAGFYLSIGLI